MSVDLEAIRVSLNGEQHELPPGLTVAGLLQRLGLRPGMVVVEHNGEILRRDGYAGAAVQAGDSLELVHFVGGG